jgi:hypothetical protein
MRTAEPDAIREWGFSGSEKTDKKAPFGSFFSAGEVGLTQLVEIMKI